MSRTKTTVPALHTRAYDGRGALESYFTSGEPPVNVRVWFEGEEESGSPALGQLLDQYGDLLRAHCMALSDASKPAGVHRPTLVTGLRGMLHVSVSVKGPSTALHSGIFGGEVLDPSLVLSRLVASLWGSNGRVGVPGFHRSVRRPSTELRRLLAAGRPSAAALHKAMGRTGQLAGESGWAVGERSMLRPGATTNEPVSRIGG
ncbi:MAG TPA: hypothetical protein VMF65_03440 [Acidimicrobiales bacterium]|nr:hypothetical protein [Acidimicrobiales bacterium]